MPQKIATVILAASLAHAASAQSDPIPAPAADDGAWTLSVTPYLWVPAQDGDLVAAGTPAEVDLSVGDTFDAITDNFNFALTLHAELNRDDVTIFGDVMYLDLQSDEDGVDVDYEMGVFELGGAYRVVNQPRGDGAIGVAVEPLAGLRAQTVSLSIDVDGGSSGSGSEFWVDAFIGARAAFEFTDWLTLKLRADIGAGGSDHVWNALAGFDIAIGDSASLQLGYRALDTDYDDGAGFEYDVLLHGPFVAFTLEF